MLSAEPSNASDLIWRSATELARLIASGSVSSVEVVEAHLQRIAAVDPQLNAVVLPLFDEARAAAVEADRRRAAGEPLGPLHGVPITVKDCFHLAGTPSGIGIDSLQPEIIATDGPLVRRLRQAGAIIVGKTNVPQGMLLHETDNPIFGRTNNPWNLDRSAGGSSGGEAAIIAAGGVPLGLASDIGGSIRQPAHVCVISGIKPTAGRLTNRGCRNNLSGLTTITTQSGVLARHVSDLTLALEILHTHASGEASYDDELPHPLGDPAAIDVAGLRVGVFEDDGFFRPSPAIRRAVRNAADILRAAGAEVVEFQPPAIAEGMEIYFGLIGADGGRGMSRFLLGGRKDWRIARLARLARVRQPWRKLFTVLASLLGQPRTALLLRSTGRKSPTEMEFLTARLARFAATFNAAMDADRIDALVFPPHALPAQTHGASFDLPASASYCYLANLLGMPAGAVAATCIGSDEQCDRKPSLQIAERVARNVELGSLGLPVGVQVMARMWREDIVLAVMKLLETEFRHLPNYPDRPPIMAN
jgi:fatty acid amide hydrolase